MVLIQEIPKFIERLFNHFTILLHPTEALISMIMKVEGLLRTSQTNIEIAQYVYCIFASS
jgi:hypothetical protein